MLKFLKLLARNVKEGVSTDPFPAKEAYTPARFRGRVTVDPELCVGCRICHHVCAGGALRIENNEDSSGYILSVWHNTCCLCGMCRHYCPTKAITLSNDWHNAHRQEEKFEWADHYEIPYVKCANCEERIRMLPPSVATRIYSHTTVDMKELMQLCPSCRQLATASREEKHHANSANEQE